MPSKTTSDYKLHIDKANTLISKVQSNGVVMNYVGGEFINTDKEEKVLFPYDANEIFRYSVCSSHQVRNAIETAHNTLDKMKALTLYERANIIERVIDHIKENKEAIASIIVFETGKTFRDSIGEVERSISTLKFSSEATKDIKGETLPLDAVKGIGKRIAFNISEPIGVVGAITGFNFPLLLAVHKLGPALGAGNTVVLKTSPNTPISSIILAYFFEKAGLPKGALSVLSGDVEVGKELVASDLVKAISFTGSSEIGKKISKQAEFKKVLLELGSNAATIIDTNKDLEEVADKLIKGGFSSNGQSCISVQRIIVNRDYSDELVNLLEGRIKEVKIGNPFDEDVQVSGLFTQSANNRILNWIKEAESLGASVISGGKLKDDILLPTIITNVSPEMEVFKEEIFGPVIVVSTYNHFEEAVKKVNQSKYGLQVGVYTDSLQNTLMAIDKIETGSVHINEVSNFRPDHMPYGGVKDSGIGKEGPKYVIEELTNKKVVSIKL